MTALPPGFKMPCPLERFRERKQEEFKAKVAHILVPFVWGPDYYGYEQITEFVKLSNGVYQERTLLVRVIDDTKYPPEWKQFIRWNEEYGPTIITPRVMIEEPEGCIVNPIEISDDEEFVPAVLSDVSDEE